MHYCDLTFGTPEADLACDEALLDFCEEGQSEALLRFWAPKQPFVVVGYGNHVATEVNTSECESLGIPIYRRCTGGGTVLQAPGCLNYTLVLRIDSHPKLGGITGTNDYVMERNRSAVQQTISAPVQREGHTDLAIDGRKFCGNAQRRRRHCLIFHGCFLLDCDLALMERALRMPSKQPDYRQSRPHTDFVRNLPVSASELKAALRKEWGAVAPLNEVPYERIETLVAERYTRPEWNRKF